MNQSRVNDGYRTIVREHQASQMGGGVMVALFG